ncbi:acyl-CoA oxidase, partial [Colletotrichum higginsianum]
RHRLVVRRLPADPDVGGRQLHAHAAGVPLPSQVGALRPQGEPRQQRHDAHPVRVPPSPRHRRRLRRPRLRRGPRRRLRLARVLSDLRGPPPPRRGQAVVEQPARRLLAPQHRPRPVHGRQELPPGPQRPRHDRPARRRHRRPAAQALPPVRPPHARAGGQRVLQLRRRHRPSDHARPDQGRHDPAGRDPPPRRAPCRRVEVRRLGPGQQSGPPRRQGLRGHVQARERGQPAQQRRLRPVPQQQGAVQEGREEGPEKQVV